MLFDIFARSSISGRRFSVADGVELDFWNIQSWRGLLPVLRDLYNDYGELVIKPRNDKPFDELPKP